MSQLDSILETAKSLSKKDQVALIERLWEMRGTAPPMPFLVTLLNRKHIESEGVTRYELSVKNLSTDYYYITSIVVPSPNHTGSRFNYFNSARAGETQVFVLDIPNWDDSEDELKFRVSGFPVPKGERLQPRKIGECTVANDPQPGGNK